MRCLTLVASGLLFLCPSAFAQSDLLNIVRVEVSAKAPMKRGATVQARTIEDYYVHDSLVLPRGTEVLGKVTALSSAGRRARLLAMSNGDFTPLRVPHIEFKEVKLRDGRELALPATVTSEGSQTVRFYARGTKHQSLIKQAWAMLIGRKNAAIKAVTAPGKKDRIEDYIYSQLPYHPQEIEEGTVYDIQLRAPFSSLGEARKPAISVRGMKQHTALRARLVTPIDSRKAKKGDRVEAIVTAPEFDEQQQVEVPQGVLLVGKVVNARASRSFGRGGTLRFNFEKIMFPEGFEQRVNGVPKAIDSNRTRELAIDSEGGVEPPSNRSVLAPLALGLLSASALTEDEAQMGHAAVASNGFGVITRVVAIATKSNVFGGVVGGISTARMVYTRFIEHGKDVKFEHGTGIEVDLGISHLPMPTVR